MKKVIGVLCLMFLANCEFKPMVSCNLSLKEKTIVSIKNSCVETPQMGIVKEF